MLSLQHPHNTAQTGYVVAACRFACRCFQQWGVLASEDAPVLDQLCCILQEVRVWQAGRAVDQLPWPVC